MRFYYPIGVLSITILFSCASETKNGTTIIEKKELKQSKVEEKILSILKETQLHESIYNNSERIQFLEQQPNLDTQANLIFQLARENLNAGNTEKALSIVKSIMNAIPGMNELSKNSKMFHEFEAICYLRIAEQKNCQENHNDQSCIVPLEDKGIHKFQDPGREAIKKYTEIVNAFPDDFQSKWLLNVSHMTLDQYPLFVPKKHLIKLDLPIDSERFSNVATQLGVDGFELSGGVIADDFDNDNHVDLIISSWSRDGNIKYWRNKGDGSFEDLSKSSGLNRITGGLNLKQADYNNDGFLDFIVLRGGWVPRSNWGILPNTLLMNNGDDTFTDVTIETGIYSVNPTQSAEWLDFNLDGWIDIFIANETTNSSDKEFKCELYLNKNGSFKNVATELNVDLVGYFKGVSSGDVNNDGYPDLYISNLKGDNELLLNVQEGTSLTFDRIAIETGLVKPFSSFPNWFFDINNDGNEDIYVATFDSLAFYDQSGQFARDMLSLPVLSEMNKVYLNLGNLKFKDASRDLIPNLALSTMGCNYGDINNDGYPDYYLGTGSPDYRSIVPNRFFLNQRGQFFVDKTFDFGLGHIQKGHAIAFIDIDEDGDQDIYANMGGAFQGDKFPNAFFLNPGTSNDWIKIKLEGNESNKFGIGARIKVSLKNLNTGKLKLKYSKISSGASFGANPLIAHIGLESGYNIELIEINWPNGENTWIPYEGLKKNEFYLIKELNQSISKIPHKKIDLQLNSHEDHTHHHH